MWFLFVIFFSKKDINNSAMFHLLMPVLNGLSSTESIKGYVYMNNYINIIFNVISIQMQRSQERESTLRGDLQEASRRQATTNEQCDRLTVELNESRTRLEQMSQESSTAKTQLLKLQVSHNLQSTSSQLGS